MVSTGPTGSGSNVFASYLINLAELQLREDVQEGFQDAFEELTNPNGNGDAHDHVAIVFTIAGAPLPEIREYIEVRRIIGEDETAGPRIDLMSIEAAMIPALNKEFGLKLRPANFKGIYRDGEKVSTFGTYAYLITSNDVPNAAVLAALSLLSIARADIRSQLGLRAGEPFPLDELPFLDAFQQKNDSEFMEMLKNLLIFVTSVTTGMVFTMTFVVWTLSTRRKIHYVGEINLVYQEFLPENTNFQQNALPHPIIFDNQTPIVEKVVHGIQRLLNILKDVQADHAASRITEAHYRHLTDGVSTMKAVFQRHLSRRLNEYRERGGQLTKEILRTYFTAGYIGRQDYEDVLRHLAGEDS